jgi:N-acetylneuraminic acid mutarotase
MKKSFISVLALVLILVIGLFATLAFSHGAQATPAAGGCWYQKAPMPKALRARAAAELDGKIYLIGGIDADDNRVDDVDVYDPATDKWNDPVDPPDLDYPRAWLVAAVVSDTIYAIGGHYPVDPGQPAGPFSKAAWVQSWSPGDAAWSWPPVPYMNYARDDAVAGVVDDAIYTIGGFDGTYYLKVTEVYSPLETTPAWTYTTATDMPYGLAMSSIGVISPTIYVFGGLDGTSATAHTLAFDTISDTWSELDDMPTAKSRAAAGVVDPLIYVIGGHSPTEGYLDKVEVYNPASDGWDTKNWMPTKRGEIAAATVGDTIYVFGGRHSWDGTVVSETQALDVNCASAPPDEPTSPGPGNWATDVELDVNLSWTASGASTYDVYFGEDVDPRPNSIGTSTPPRVSTGQGTNTYNPDLKPNTSYVWRVVAIGSGGAVTSFRERWTFTTEPIATVTKTADPTEVPEPGGNVDFTVGISNADDAPITLTGLVDDVHGNLNGQGTCAVPQTIGAGGNYACTFSAEVSGDADDTETDIVTATIGYGSGSTFGFTASATVTVTDALPNVTVTKTADPTDVPEPGGTVQFTVEVANNGEPVTLDSLTDSVRGNLNGQGTCSVPQTIGVGATYSCSFSAAVSGDAGDSEKDTVTATVRDDEDNSVEATGDATVTISDVLPEISVTVTPDQNDVNPGTSVGFTIRVDNDSVEQVKLMSLNDNVFGNLNGQGSCAIPPTGVPIGVSGFYECAFTKGLYADHSSTVTATAEDNEGNPATATADVSVNVLVPAIRVVIEPSTTSAYVGETVSYTYTVENIGDFPLSNVGATDDRLGSISLGKSSLAPGESTMGVASYVVKKSDWPGVLTNNVTATGKPSGGPAVNDTDTAMVQVGGETFLPAIVSDNTHAAVAP